LAVSTIKAAERHLADFVRVFGSLNAASMKPWQLTSWVESHTTWRTDAALAGGCNAVRIAFSWAARMGVIAGDPFCGIRYVSHDTREAISLAEHAALITRCGDPVFCDMLTFLWETGARPEELTRLQKTQIRFDLGLLVIREHKTAKRTHEDREIPITSKLRVVLERTLLRWPTSPHVFLTQTGNPWKVSCSLSHKFRRLRRAAKVRPEISLYSYRHALATRLITSGVPDIIVARILGHKDTRMLKRYAHPPLSQLVSAMEMVSQQV